MTKEFTFVGGPLDGQTMALADATKEYIHHEPNSGVVDAETGRVIDMAYQECLYVRKGDTLVYTRVSG